MKLEMYNRIAMFSEDKVYRYSLVHYWGENIDNPKESEFCCFIGLNPSTADALQDDPTIRRCVAFARRWGFNGMAMANAFAFRATNPKVMLKAVDRVGPENLEHLKYACTLHTVIAAWGGNCPIERERELMEIFKGREIKCLDTNDDGSPQHPLYVRADKELIPYKWRI